MTLKITNSGDENHLYGHNFVLEKKADDTWFQSGDGGWNVMNEGQSFDGLGVVLNPGATNEFIASLESALDAGTYRIILDVSSGNGEAKPISAEFTVEAQ